MTTTSQTGQHGQHGQPIEHDDEVAVIVGSGAGGGTVAHELTARGIRCVVLDYDTLKGIDNSEHRLF